MSSAVLCGLSAGCVRYDAVGRGARPELTKAELAGLLSGLSQQAVNFALAVFCDDVSSFQLCQFHGVRVAVEFSRRYDWRCRSQEVVVALGVLAAIEFVRPDCCLSCHSLSMVEGKVCSCGRRRGRIREVDRYQFVGVSARSWRGVWRDRYGYLVDYFQVIAGQVDDCVARSR